MVLVVREQPISPTPAAAWGLLGPKLGPSPGHHPSAQGAVIVGVAIPLVAFALHLGEPSCQRVIVAAAVAATVAAEAFTVAGGTHVPDSHLAYPTVDPHTTRDSPAGSTLVTGNLDALRIVGDDRTANSLDAAVLDSPLDDPLDRMLEHLGCS